MLSTDAFRLNNPQSIASQHQKAFDAWEGPCRLCEILAPQSLSTKEFDILCISTTFTSLHTSTGLEGAKHFVCLLFAQFVQ
jgi:hypothetical protein